MTDTRVFPNRKQMLICVGCTVAISAALSLISYRATRGTIAARPYWWGLNAQAYLLGGIWSGFAASYIGAIHEETQLKALWNRYRYALATTTCIGAIIALLDYAAVTLAPKNTGFPNGIGVLPSLLSCLLVFGAGFAPQLAGIGRMKPLAAAVASLRMFKSRLGWGLLLVPIAALIAVNAIVKMCLPAGATDTVSRYFLLPVLGGVVEVVVSSKIWTALQKANKLQPERTA